MMVEEREERESSWDLTMAMLEGEKVRINFWLLTFAESSQ